MADGDFQTCTICQWLPLYKVSSMLCAFLSHFSLHKSKEKIISNSVTRIHVMPNIMQLDMQLAKLLSRCDRTLYSVESNDT